MYVSVNVNIQWLSQEITVVWVQTFLSGLFMISEKIHCSSGFYRSDWAHSASMQDGLTFTMQKYPWPKSIKRLSEYRSSYSEKRLTWVVVKHKIPYNLKRATKSSPWRSRSAWSSVLFVNSCSATFDTVKRGHSCISWPCAWCRCCPSLRSLHILKQLYFTVFGWIISGQSPGPCW